MIDRSWRTAACACLAIASCLSVRAQSADELDTGFRVVLSFRSDPPPGLQAHLTTTMTYPCEGYGLRATATWNRDTVNILVGGMVRPATCISSMAEAEGDVYVGNPGMARYVLRIMYRGHADLYRIDRGRRTTITPLANKFTSVQGP